MNLSKIIKDFFNPEVHKAINNFLSNGEMVYADRNFPEQVVLASHGYVSSSIINFGTFIVDDKFVNYERGYLNPKAIIGSKTIPIRIMHWTEDGIRFRTLKHPLSYLYSMITGESFIR